MNKKKKIRSRKNKQNKIYSESKVTEKPCFETFIIYYENKKYVAPKEPKFCDFNKEFVYGSYKEYNHTVSIITEHLDPKSYEYFILFHLFSYFNYNIMRRDTYEYLLSTCSNFIENADKIENRIQIDKAKEVKKQFYDILYENTSITNDPASIICEYLEFIEQDVYVLKPFVGKSSINICLC